MKLVELVLSALSSLIIMLMTLMAGCQTNHYWKYPAKVPVVISDGYAADRVSTATDRQTNPDWQYPARVPQVIADGYDADYSGDTAKR